MRTTNQNQGKQKKPSTRKRLLADEVFKAIKKGDERELSLIYEEFRNPFKRWLNHKFSIGEEVGQEIYQKAFIILYENIKSGKLKELHSSIRTYIFGIGRYLVKDHWRECKKAFDSIEALPESCHQLDMQTEKEELARHHQRWMSGMIHTLPPKAQKVLYLYYYANYSMEAIAREMGYKNEKVAKKVKYDSLQKLRKVAKASIYAMAS